VGQSVREIGLRRRIGSLVSVSADRTTCAVE